MLSHQYVPQIPATGSLTYQVDEVEEFLCCSTY